jgi:diacylglycerol kinase (ATP)
MFVTNPTPQSATPSHWTIILNPAAGRGRANQLRTALEAILKHTLSSPGPEGGAVSWNIVETQKPGDACGIARELAEANDSSVGITAAGGDGTLGDVVNGVLQSGKQANIAVIPFGTGNDFARCLGIGTSLELAVATLRDGSPQLIDLGQLHNNASGKEGRYFINIAGCGFDAVVAERINQGFRSLRGTPAYIAAVIQTLGRFRPTPIYVICDGVETKTRAMLCALANATSYGGGMLVAPDARLDDGLLDICIIGDASRTEFLRAFPSVFKGKHTVHPKVSMHRAQHIRIESEIPLPVLVDGELCGTTPIEVQIVPHALRIMMPQLPAH